MSVYHVLVGWYDIVKIWEHNYENNRLVRSFCKIFRDCLKQNSILYSSLLSRDISKNFYNILKTLASPNFLYV